MCTSLWRKRRNFAILRPRRKKTSNKNKYMVSSRGNTALPPTHSVRFYKIIALTFLALTIVLLAVVVFMSSKRADITITTKSSPIDVHAEVVIGSDVMPNSVDGEVKTETMALSKTFEPTGNRQEPGISTGVVTLHNDTSSDQPLVKTTRVLTPDGTLFRLTEAVVVPKNGTVDAAVYADKEGPSGNISAVDKWTIPGLNETKQKVIYGSSSVAMTGGVRNVGILSQADVEKARKQLEGELQQEASSAFGEVDATKPVVFSAVIDSLSVGSDIGTEVSEFSVTATATVVSVQYDEAAVAQWATTQLRNRAIGDSDIITAANNKPTVTFSAYDANAGIATLGVFMDGTVTLNPEGSDLSKEMFFGKDKNEVRRYLLTLDHVHKVEIDFSPVWMQTVPHIHEHVTIKVKEVE